MVIIRRSLFFKSARVILEDELLIRLLREKRYSYISGLSYNGALAIEGSTPRSKKTVIVPLERANDEELFMQMSETTRNEIRRTFKMPELRFAVPDSQRDKIYALYKAFEVSGKRLVRSLAYFKKSIFAGAYHNDELIAAIILYDAKPVLRINAIVSRRGEGQDVRKLVSFATRRLIYELCRFGRDHEYTEFDLGGVNLSTSTKAGIAAFKMSFGGVLRDEYMYTHKSCLFHYVNSLFNKRR